MPVSLSHEDMRRVIDSGGSVLHGGVIHTSHDTLPSEAALARGDASREAAVRQGIQAQIAALSGQLAALEAETAPAPPEQAEEAPETAERAERTEQPAEKPKR